MLSLKKLNNVLKNMKEESVRITNQNRRYDLKGLQIAAIALAITALSDFAIHVIRMFEKNNIAEFAYIGLTFIAWVMMFAGCRKIMEYSYFFKKAYYAVLPAISATLIWGIITAFDVQSKLGWQSFISMGAMLMSYISFMCKLYVYTNVLKGSGEVAGELRRNKLMMSCFRIWKPGFMILILTLFCVQGAPLFSELIKYIITVTAAIIALIMEMLMIRNLLAVYDIADGKVRARRLDEMLASMEKTEELLEEEENGKDSTVASKPKGVSGDIIDSLRKEKELSEERRVHKEKTEVLEKTEIKEAEKFGEEKSEEEKTGTVIAEEQISEPVEGRKEEISSEKTEIPEEKIETFSEKTEILEDESGDTIAAKEDLENELGTAAESGLEKSGSDARGSEESGSDEYDIKKGKCEE